MSNRTKHNNLRYSAAQQIRRLKRAVINRRGDGVHSPYAFRLIRQVFRNPHPYHCFGTLEMQYRHRRGELRSQYGDCLITRLKDLETIFRLIVDHKSEEVILFAPKDSLLPFYLEQTSCVTRLHHIVNGSNDNLGELIKTTDCIIIEDIASEALTSISPILAQIDRQPRATKLVITHQANPSIRKGLRAMKAQVVPSVCFHLLRLQVWAWRDAITHGEYTVHY